MAEATTCCPACGSDRYDAFHEQHAIPVHSCLLLPDRDAAVEFPRGDLRLAACDDCGFIWNTSFDPSRQRYSTSYEETQGFSPRFQAFARDLAERWVDRYDLRGKRIVEIGCGKGEFLELLCDFGGNEGIGIDPSYVPGRVTSHEGKRLTFLQELYSEAHGAIDADAVVCRHTLEHIGPVREFMSTIRRSLGERTDTVVLFELPDVLRVLREVAFWDIYYEHCSYFTLGSLARLFRSTGFEILDLSVDFDGQYLLVEAVPSSSSQVGPPLPQEDDRAALRSAVGHFQRGFADQVRRWRAELAGGPARRTALWGSGSKGVAYLNTLGVGGEVGCVVDINPFKHGRFMAGTGHEIVAPEHLQAYRPDLVIAMNPVYVDEIQRNLDELDVPAALVAV